MRSTVRITLGSCLAAAALCAGAIATLPTGVQHHSESPAPGLPLPPLPALPLPAPVGPATA